MVIESLAQIPNSLTARQITDSRCVVTSRQAHYDLLIGSTARGYGKFKQKASARHMIDGTLAH